MHISRANHGSILTFCALSISTHLDGDCSNVASTFSRVPFSGVETKIVSALVAEHPSCPHPGSPRKPSCAFMKTVSNAAQLCTLHDVSLSHLSLYSQIPSSSFCIQPLVGMPSKSQFLLLIKLSYLCHNIKHVLSNLKCLSYLAIILPKLVCILHLIGICIHGISPIPIKPSKTAHHHHVCNLNISDECIVARLFVVQTISSAVTA